MDAACLGAGGRASMHAGRVDGRGPRRVGLLCWRAIVCIMLAGFQEDRAGDGASKERRMAERLMSKSLKWKGNCLML